MHKKSFFLLPAIMLAVSIAGCSSNSTSKKTDINSSSSGDTSNAPVETNKPNSDYKPSFVGQTRIKSVKTTTPYSVEKI
ncbi:MAG TPA: hypothetical protein VLR49_05940, partial [Ferruginibacter sp.]|nr:hypothetical protein [Ferruginibacter sp.]